MNDLVELQYGGFSRFELELEVRHSGNGISLS